MVMKEKLTGRLATVKMIYKQHRGTCQEIAELIYTEGYNAFAVYEATGLLPELKLRKPTEEEVEEMRRQGYRYYGRFEKEGKGKTNE